MNNLEKFFYISIGFLSDTTKKLEQNLQKLVEQGKISDIDAKRIISDFKKSFNKYSADINEKFKHITENTLESLKFAKKEQIQKLHKRLDLLEQKIKQL